MNSEWDQARDREPSRYLQRNPNHYMWRQQPPKMQNEASDCSGQNNSHLWRNATPLTAANARVQAGLKILDTFQSKHTSLWQYVVSGTTQKRSSTLATRATCEKQQDPCHVCNCQTEGNSKNDGNDCLHSHTTSKGLTLPPGNVLWRLGTSGSHSEPCERRPDPKRSDVSTSFWCVQGQQRPNHKTPGGDEAENPQHESKPIQPSNAVRPN